MEPLTPRPSNSGNTRPAVSTSSRPMSSEETPKDHGFTQPVAVKPEPIQKVQSSDPTQAESSAEHPGGVSQAAESNTQNHTIASAPAHAVNNTNVNGPGTLIVQWLTYAFWGWTILALSTLTAAVIANFLTKTDSGAFSIYNIAAVLVLLPFAFVADKIYSKHEPVKKSGPAMAIMVIHAVIFALIGIGSLITAVFFGVSLLVEPDGEPKAKYVVILSALIIFAYYAFTFLRTLNPAAKFPRLAKIYRLGMLATVGVIILLGIFGPVAHEWSLRDDKLIESNLNGLQRSINNYVNDNEKLPESLADLPNLEGGQKAVIDKKLVEYNPNTQPPAVAHTNNNYSSGYFPGTTRKTFFYELCATFREESPYYDTYRNSRNDEYNTYISSFGHPAGKHCYKIRTTDY